MAVLGERRTQQQRRAEARTRLLDATVQCLVEGGYQGTTVRRVSDAAGVSVGAAQHHFPTKAMLVEAGVEELGRRRIALARSLAAEAEPTQPAVLDALWATHTGELGRAACEIWLAARTDPLLHAPEARADEAFRAAATALLAGARGPAEVDAVGVDLVLDAMRGLALRHVLVEPAALQGMWERRREDVLALLAARPA